MSTALDEIDSIDDLLVNLGGISPKRVRFRPAPGTATVDDVERVRVKTRRICELVDGTLVEKVMGLAESVVAQTLRKYLHRWNDDNGEPGFLAGEAGTIKLMNKLVRAPDLAFTYLNRAPGGCVPSAPVPDLAPDLAVEVLSEGNTREEMERKLKEYFMSDVRLVWYLDLRTRTVRVYTSPDDVTELTASDTLGGGDVLPGFTLPIAQLFSKLDPTTEPKANGGTKPKKRK
ncbi:MAG: Uma2 family endonuclease [Planctomycetes bacterium]|nr:Uma2 family endonuclease [Planctomycetota bacterium]